ncbi:hypothetical protein [Mycobacterium spongiae]|uniref:Membrane protein ArfC n=1 Tax=Mycobacterium spongiae TaxID=886343 RepID=A0A975JZZ8_9MYCO|nr:hypothetical protein [Mycobacterium spongiae]QUR68844.1 hypothetical protein F6B93_18745 [Mycobacterium spongiae]
MQHVHWSLTLVAFVLGMVLTSTLMVQPVKPEVPVKKPTREPGMKPRPTTAKKAPAGKPRPKKRPAGQKATTAKTPGAKRSAKPKRPAAKTAPRKKIPVPRDTPTDQIPVSEESTAAHLARRPHAPYGPGSARADADGSGPPGWSVKGRSDTRLYYTPADRVYDPTLAQVWFKDEESAVRAFFTPWRDRVRR